VTRNGTRKRQFYVLHKKARMGCGLVEWWRRASTLVSSDDGGPIITPNAVPAGARQPRAMKARRRLPRRKPPATARQRAGPPPHGRPASAGRNQSGLSEDVDSSSVLTVGRE